MTDAKPFVGAWKLLSWEVMLPDGTIEYPYGKDAVGYLLYTADGYMSAHLMDPDRQQSDPNFPLEPAAPQNLSERDRARAYSTYLAYCGTYRVEGNTVIHHVKAGLTPSWTDSEQRRPFQLVQDRLIIQLGNMKQELAIMLFEQDRLTLSQAAALAEIRLLPFQHLLASRGIPPHYDVTEYEQDVATLRGMGRLE